MPLIAAPTAAAACCACCRRLLSLLLPPASPAAAHTNSLDQNQLPLRCPIPPPLPPLQQDLHDILEQTVGTGINVWTHGELLPAHGYPALKEAFPHLVGNYGGAWYRQVGPA